MITPAKVSTLFQLTISTGDILNQFMKSLSFRSPPRRFNILNLQMCGKFYEHGDLFLLARCGCGKWKIKFNLNFSLLWTIYKIALTFPTHPPTCLGVREPNLDCQISNFSLASKHYLEAKLKVLKMTFVPNFMWAVSANFFQYKFLLWYQQ
jgi:hypothetical protein